MIRRLHEEIDTIGELHRTIQQILAHLPEPDLDVGLISASEMSVHYQTEGTSVIVIRASRPLAGGIDLRVFQYRDFTRVGEEAFDSIEQLVSRVRSLLGVTT